MAKSLAVFMHAYKDFWWTKVYDMVKPCACIPSVNGIVVFYGFRIGWAKGLSCYDVEL